MQASQSNLSDALAECLDAMALGPWALADCLERHSHYRRDLEPLLRLASLVRDAVREVSAPPPYLYLLPGGRSRPQAADPGPLLARAWRGLDYGLRHAARQHTLAVRSALLVAFLLLAISGWVLVVGSAAVMSVLAPPLEPLWLALTVGFLPWVFLVLAVRSAERWLVLLACSPPLPGQVAAPLRRRGLQLLGVLRDLWDSPAVGLRLLYRLSVWGLVRVVGLALVLGWVLPLLTAAR
jgi:hypothetical protein